jgi:hypothetical protein
MTFFRANCDVLICLFSLSIAQPLNMFRPRLFYFFSRQISMDTLCMFLDICIIHTSWYNVGTDDKYIIGSSLCMINFTLNI